MSRKSLLLLIAALVLAVVALYGAAWFRARTLVDEQLQQLVANGQYEKADYSSLWLTPWGALTINQLELKQPDLDLVLERLSVSDLDFFHAPPRHLTITAHGLRFPAGLPDLSSYSPLLATLLHSVSHDNTVLADIEYGYSTDPADADRMLFKAALSLPNLAELRASAEVLHWSQAAAPAAGVVLAGSAAQPQPLTGNETVPHATLSLQDKGMVSIFLQAMAQDSHTSMADTRAVLASQLRNAYQLLPANVQTLSRQGGGELANFLQGGKTLTLTVAPIHDGNVAMLQQELLGAALTGGYDKAAEILQLKITTE